MSQMAEVDRCSVDVEISLAWPGPCANAISVVSEGIEKVTRPPAQAKHQPATHRILVFQRFQSHVFLLLATQNLRIGSAARAPTWLLKRMRPSSSTK